MLALPGISPVASIGTVLLVAAASLHIMPAHAADPDRRTFGIGFGAAQPSAGISVLAELNDRVSSNLIVRPANTAWPPSFQVQLNHESGGDLTKGYWLIGGGMDETLVVARAGYGYRWRVRPFVIHLEAAYNHILSDETDRSLGVLLLLLPFAFGIHYAF